MLLAVGEMYESIPHACGGEPAAISYYWSLFNRIPHACGGEPDYADIARARIAYSPRVWG